MEDYVPLEEKLVKNLFSKTDASRRAVGTFLKESIVSAYAAAVTPLRLPTAIRKACNSQTYFDRYPDDIADKAQRRGRAIGIASVGLFYAFYVLGLKDATPENTFPNPPYSSLVTFGITNLLSAVFELGRFPKSRKERKKILEARVSEPPM